MKKLYCKCGKMQIDKYSMRYGVCLDCGYYPIFSMPVDSRFSKAVIDPYYTKINLILDNVFPHHGVARMEAPDIFNLYSSRLYDISERIENIANKLNTRMFDIARMYADNIDKIDNEICKIKNDIATVAMEAFRHNKKSVIDVFVGQRKIKEMWMKIDYYESIKYRAVDNAVLKNIIHSSDMAELGPLINMRNTYAIRLYLDHKKFDRWSNYIHWVCNHEDMSYYRLLLKEAKNITDKEDAYLKSICPEYKGRDVYVGQATMLKMNSHEPREDVGISIDNCREYNPRYKWPIYDISTESDAVDINDLYNDYLELISRYGSLETMPM